MIKIDIDDIDNNIIAFKISGINIGLANSIRRILIAEIPTMCINFVNISENSSNLHDNIIAHRLGLIPFHSKYANKFKYTWELDSVSDADLYEVEYQLNVSNKTEHIVDVTTNDLVLIVNNKIPKYKQLFYKSVKPITYDSDPIIITKLNTGQQLSFQCSVRKGIAKEHAKYQPTTVVGYDIIDDNTFNFAVETTGVLNIVEVMNKTFDILKDKLKFLKTHI